MKPPRVVVIVLNWNNLADTLDCLASVTASTYPALDVTLVDNHSDQDPTPAVRSKFPAVDIAREPDNLGYAGGNNGGIRRAVQENADYVFLLNNDALIADDTIARLVDVAERYPAAAFVTPRIMIYGTTDVYWEGGTLNWSTGEAPHDPSSLPLREPGVRETVWSNGCALLVRVSAIRQIGLMATDYFLYYEDVDWSVRAARAGWEQLIALEARCWHKVSRTSGGGSAPKARYYYARNRYRFLARHAAGRLSRLRHAKQLFGDYDMYRREPPLRQAILAAAVDALTGRCGARDLRRAGWLPMLDSIFEPSTRVALRLHHRRRALWRRLTSAKPA